MTSRRQRIIAGIGANASGQVQSAIMQVASLPIFLHFWAMPVYGRWLLLSAIPGYFSLADAGLGAVAMNRMTMLSAAGEHRKSNEIFQTTVLMIMLAGAVATLVSAPIVWYTASGPTAEVDRLTLLLLIVLALLNIFATMFDAVFRASGRFAYGVHLLNAGRLLEWLGGMAGLAYAHSMSAVAAGMLLARVAFTFAMVRYCALRFPLFTWSARAASRREFKALIVPGVSFLAFPLGNALSFQGMTILVGSAFGPVALAAFNTYRTLSRLLVQALAVFSRSLWPEMSRHYGSREIVELQHLYIHGTRTAAYACGAACVLLWLPGRALVEHWTGGKIPYMPGLFAGFLAVAFASCLWQVGMVVLQATNNHRRLAVVFVEASVLMLALAALMPRSLGLTGPVLALGVFELVMSGASFRLVADLFATPSQRLAHT